MRKYAAINICEECLSRRSEQSQVKCQSLVDRPPIDVCTFKNKRVFNLVASDGGRPEIAWETRKKLKSMKHYQYLPTFTVTRNSQKSTFSYSSIHHKVSFAIERIYMHTVRSIDRIESYRFTFDGNRKRPQF